MLSETDTIDTFCFCCNATACLTTVPTSAFLWLNGKVPKPKSIGLPTTIVSIGPSWYEGIKDSIVYVAPLK